MLKINCDFCKKELKKAGGLLFGPPKEGLSVKTHLCVACYKEVIANKTLKQETKEYVSIPIPSQAQKKR